MIVFSAWLESSALLVRDKNELLVSAKSLLRVTAQSLARQFGPQGVHVAHMIIYGGVNAP